MYYCSKSFSFFQTAQVWSILISFCLLFRYPWPSWACLRYTTSKYYDMKSSFGHYWLESILSYLYHYITYGNAKQTGLFPLSRISWYLSNSFHMVLYCDETALCFLSFAYFVLWSSFLSITTCNHACVASVWLVFLTTWLIMTANSFFVLIWTKYNITDSQGTHCMW